MSSQQQQQIKLPLQLASLIHGEAENVMGEEDACLAGGGGGGEERRNLNAIVAAAHTRHVKELGSYVRAVCMRMGYHNSTASAQQP